jgi:hypothetical protein
MPVASSVANRRVHLQVAWSLLLNGVQHHVRNIWDSSSRRQRIWQERIERVLRNTPAMSASERFWLDEMNNLFKAAQRRLDELVGIPRDGSSSSQCAR